MQPALGYGWLKSAQYDFRSGQKKGKESRARAGEKGGKRLGLGGGSRAQIKAAVRLRLTGTAA